MMYTYHSWVYTYPLPYLTLAFFKETNAWRVRQSLHHLPTSTTTLTLNLIFGQTLDLSHRHCGGLLSLIKLPSSRPSVTQPALMSTAESQSDSRVAQSEGSSQTTAAIEGQQSTYAGMATSVAGSAAETATNAAVGVKDTMFSMFGGGGKKEVKDEKAGEGEEDRSGSAKAAKEKEKEKEGGDEEDAVGHLSFACQR